MKLDVKSLNFSYSNNVILKDISFSLPEGGSLFIVGKNGSGKTTLLKNICGFFNPQSGSITFNDDKGVENDLRSNMGIFLNDFGLYDYLTVDENFNLFKNYYQLSQAEYLENYNKIVLLLDLSSLLKQKVKKLSSGQKQKASLGISLLNNPSLILLDEPLNNLDQNSIYRLSESLKKLVDERAILIVVSHQLSEIPSWVNQIGLLQNGELHLLTNDAGNMQYLKNLLIN